MTAPGQPSPLPPQQKRVLFVDDEETLRLVAEMYLQQAGYLVATAENGLDAWDKFTHEGCDLLITDLNMPELDGIGLIRRVRATGRSVPIIVHASIPTWQQAKALRALAVDATVEKIPEHGSLRETVERVLSQSR